MRHLIIRLVFGLTVLLPLPASSEEPKVPNVIEGLQEKCFQPSSLGTYGSQERKCFYDENNPQDGGMCAFVTRRKGPGGLWVFIQEERQDDCKLPYYLDKITAQLVLKTEVDDV